MSWACLCSRAVHLKCPTLKIAPAFQSVRWLSGRPADTPPLQGIRVIDLTRIVAGPYCTMILGDLGADVLKIEKPGTGDEARRWNPPFVTGTKEGCYFICLNRNKRSMCIDMKKESGKKIIYDLAKISDVLVENYVPGKLDELNLGYEDLKSVAPHLVYCSITGYGSEGLYSHKPGYDVIAASLGGFLHITGPENGEPVKPGVAMTDLSTGLYAHGAIMAALLKQTRTGLGQKIDCNLLSTQLACLINIGSNYLNAGKESKKWGTAHENIVPYQSFSTKNGYLTIGAGSDKQFVDLCKRIGHPHLAQDPKYLTNTTRVQNRKELIGLLSSVMSTKTNEQWAEILEGASFPFGPVNTVEQAFNDPHVKSIKLVEEVQHPTGGTIRLVGPPVKYSEGGNSIRLPPPLLGQHTDEILKDVLEYDEEQIDTLHKSKTVF